MTQSIFFCIDCVGSHPGVRSGGLLLNRPPLEWAIIRRAWSTRCACRYFRGHPAPCRKSGCALSRPPPGASVCDGQARQPVMEKAGHRRASAGPVRGGRLRGRRARACRAGGAPPDRVGDGEARGGLVAGQYRRASVFPSGPARSETANGQRRRVKESGRGGIHRSRPRRMSHFSERASPLRSRLTITPFCSPLSSSTAPFWLVSTTTCAPFTKAAPAPPWA